MSILALLFRIVLAVVLVTPAPGGCAFAPAVADPASSAVAADPPPCHGEHGGAADAVDTPPTSGPATDDHGSDGCGHGSCDCGCPCRALSALANIAVGLSAPPRDSLSPDPRLAPRPKLPPPPPTPPPIG